MALVLVVLVIVVLAGCGDAARELRDAFENADDCGSLQEELESGVAT
jgi:hypothetical protein